MFVATMAVMVLLPACQGRASGTLPAIHPQTNPAVQSGIAVVFRFADLPGSVRDPGAAVHYTVTNRDCVPMDRTAALGGVRLLPKYRLATLVHRNADGSLVLWAWQDALHDEDYYGLGPCRWALESVTFTFVSDRGNPFVVSLAADELAPGTVHDLRFRVSDFEAPVTGPSRPPIFAEPPDFYPVATRQFSVRVSVSSINGE